MLEDESTQPIRLVVQPDFDDICWTHFRVPCGMVGVLQELPKPLRRMISGFVGTLRACQIERLDLCIPGTIETRLRNAHRRPRPFEYTLSASLREGLILLSWWLVFNHHKQIGQTQERLKTNGSSSAWHCPDCGQRIQSKREFCENASCSSWNKLHLCTGEPILRLVSRTA